MCYLIFLYVTAAIFFFYHVELFEGESTFYKAGAKGTNNELAVP